MPEVKVLFGETEAQYVVIREGGKAPNRRHPKRFLAEREAERLAQRHPGAVFHVAKIKKTVTAPTPAELTT